MKSPGRKAVLAGPLRNPVAVESGCLAALVDLATRRIGEPHGSSTTVAFLARGSDLLPDGWERMDERCIDRGNVGAVGRIVAGGKGADAPLVHAGTGSGIGGSVSGWAAGAGAAQDRLDAGRGGG